jgi:hypothetical protein
MKIIGGLQPLRNLGLDKAKRLPSAAKAEVVDVWFGTAKQAADNSSQWKKQQIPHL